MFGIYFVYFFLMCCARMHLVTVGDDGATALAPAICASSSLTILEVRDNYISSAGATSLAAAVAGSSSLASLNLSGNHAVGVLVCRRNSRLVSIERPNLILQGARAIAAALEANSTLRSLSMLGATARFRACSAFAWGGIAVLRRLGA